MCAGALTASACRNDVALIVPASDPALTDPAPEPALSAVPAAELGLVCAACTCPSAVRLDSAMDGARGLLGALNAAAARIFSMSEWARILAATEAWLMLPARGGPQG